MPKDLAALLVEDGAVPADLVERALERQREAGGALDTALLELGALAENRLTEYLGRASELPPAPPTAWGAGDARARRVFPSRVAERHGLAPFALDGRELALVATYPVDLGLLDEISFMLSLHLTAHVGPEWRVRELIHRIYGGVLTPRLAALAAAAGGAPAETSAPPEEEPAAVERPAPPTTAAAMGGFSRDDSEPLEPLAAALAEALESVDIPVDDLTPGSEATAAAQDVAPAEEELEDEGPEEESAPEEPPDRSAPPHWTLADARAAVGAAHHRDRVVLAALRYARDFFEFAAMFAVTRDAVAGHDALGFEGARDHARTVAIWSSDPGIFKTVIETQSPYLGPVAMGVAGTDAVLNGLGRKPRTVLVYPVMLRDRPVCLLYADNGEAPVSARRLGDLLMFLSTVGGEFERIIRDRKKRRRVRRSPARAAETGAAPGQAGPERATVPVAETPIAPEAEPAPAPEPEPESSAEPVASEAPAPSDEEPALSFAGLDAEPPGGDGPPEAPSSPPTEPVRAPPRGGTAVQWPALDTHADASNHALRQAQGERSEAAVSEWAGEEPAHVIGDSASKAPEAPAPGREPAGATPASSAVPEGRPAPSVADSLSALEDQFFTGAEEAPPAAPGAAPEPAPVPVPRVAPAAAAPPVAPAPATSPAPVSPAPAGTAAPKPSPLPAAPRQGPPPSADRPPAATPPEPATLAALADRALDPDPDVAAAACAALGNRRRDPAARQAAEKLRRALLSGISARASRAALAIGALRDADAIPLLIQVLETSEPETARLSADALAAITLQRLGPDARRWLGWWKENRGRGRAEWLFSGLTSADRETRVAASVELSSAAPPPVVYTPDLPSAEREKAARAWAGWWSRSGHVL